jgi:hypothetical protein
MTGCVPSVKMAKPSASPKPARGGDVGEIHIFGAVPLSAGSSSKPAGIGLVVYATAAEGSRGLVVRRGSLDILMFDSSDSNLDLRAAKPVKVWTFDPAQLEGFKSESRLGQGYKLSLLWDESGPKGKTVTVVARYRGPRGVELYSAPNPVLISVK